jgi:hypothetical protein
MAISAPVTMRTAPSTTTVESHQGNDASPSLDAGEVLDTTPLIPLSCSVISHRAASVVHSPDDANFWILRTVGTVSSRSPDPTWSALFLSAHRDIPIAPDYCRRQAWLLKKSRFLPNSQNLGDVIMSRKLRTSFVGYPSAILFLLISREGVFQQPQATTLAKCIIMIARSPSWRL